MSESSPKPIVLDRDGVINEDLWGYVTKKEEFKHNGNQPKWTFLLKSWIGIYSLNAHIKYGCRVFW